MKFKLPTYAFAFEAAETFILKTILSLAAKLQVEGSAEPLAPPVCHEVCTPVETLTVLPQAVKPLVLLRYTW